MNAFQLCGTSWSGHETFEIGRQRKCDQNFPRGAYKNEITLSNKITEYYK